MKVLQFVRILPTITCAMALLTVSCTSSSTKSSEDDELLSSEESTSSGVSLSSMDEGSSTGGSSNQESSSSTITQLSSEAEYVDLRSFYSTFMTPSANAWLAPANNQMEWELRKTGSAETFELPEGVFFRLYIGEGAPYSSAGDLIADSVFTMSANTGVLAVGNYWTKICLGWVEPGEDFVSETACGNPIPFYVGMDKDNFILWSKRETVGLGSGSISDEDGFNLIDYVDGTFMGITNADYDRYRAFSFDSSFSGSITKAAYETSMAYVKSAVSDGSRLYMNGMVSASLYAARLDASLSHEVVVTASVANQNDNPGQVGAIAAAPGGGFYTLGKAKRTPASVTEEYTLVRKFDSDGNEVASISYPNRSIYGDIYKTQVDPSGRYLVYIGGANSPTAVKRSEVVIYDLQTADAPAVVYSINLPCYSMVAGETGITATCENNGYGADGGIFHISYAGSLQWSKTATDYDPKAVTEVGNHLVVVGKDIQAGSESAVMFKYDTDGNMIWDFYLDRDAATSHIGNISTLTHVIHVPEHNALYSIGHTRNEVMILKTPDKMLHEEYFY